MRFFLPLLFFVLSCYAFEGIALESSLYEKISDNNDGPLQTDFRLPAKSQLSAGKVQARNIGKVALSYSLFVLGDDSLSRAWLKEQAQKLQAIHAIGLVTNITSEDTLAELETLAGMPLHPINVDSLAKLLSIKHYPFVLEGGRLWQ